MKEVWIENKTNKELIKELKKDMRLIAFSDIVLNIMINRGYKDAESIVKFLRADINDLRDASIMKDAIKAVNVIEDTIKNNEGIVFYTDFDVDGCCSAAVGILSLRKLGVNANYYVNNRFTQGYGICNSGIDELLKRYPNTKLIITTDNGIVANNAIDYAKSLGLKVVVTDHHEPSDILPNADAVVDPKRKDEEYPFHEFCGTGVIFKLMCLLYKMRGRKEREIYRLLDIVALATVADVVPILDENRIMVQKGLMLINQQPSTVFQAFASVSALVTEATAHHTLGFIYGPMINAVGRLDGSPDEVIDMLISKDPKKILTTMKKLREINTERQKITEEQTEEAIRMVESKKLDDVIVIYNENFHEGIIGLIAGRLKEEYCRPVFVFTKTENGIKGSGRSVDNFHLKEVLDSVSSLLVGYGGHAKAAGASIKEENIEKFRIEINKIAKKFLKEEDFIKEYKIDTTINEFEITNGIVDDLKILEPYGEAFPKPIFLVKDCELTSKPAYMGKEKQHVKLTTTYFPIMLWRKAEEFKGYEKAEKISVIGFPEINSYRGLSSLQFVGKSFK